MQQIVTDLSASRSRLDGIDRRAEELLAVKAAAPANIRARVKSIHDRSDSINKLRQAKERSLQGANRCVYNKQGILFGKECVLTYLFLI